MDLALLANLMEMLKINGENISEKYTSKIKFPIILYIGRKQFTVETEIKLLVIILRLWQNRYDIYSLMYEELEYVEFEEISTDIVKV